MPLAPGKRPRITKAQLEALYRRFNRRAYVQSDPVGFLYRYPDLSDREAAGLVAACLAYGRVGQIAASVSTVLEKMGPSPRAFLENTPPRSLDRAFCGFRHRFCAGEDLSALLRAMKKLIQKHGSLEAAFSAGHGPDAENVLGGLGAFSSALAKAGGFCANHLVPCPEKGSAVKRLNLYLRWMVREDAVDPGGWRCVRPSQLIVPLDTHMHRIGLDLGLTGRASAGMKTALEITAALKVFRPEDPVRYDFALTRPGILKLGADHDTDFKNGNHLKGKKR